VSNKELGQVCEGPNRSRDVGGAAAAAAKKNSADDAARIAGLGEMKGLLNLKRARLYIMGEPESPDRDVRVTVPVSPWPGGAPWAVSVAGSLRPSGW
jgi:hypothetical protein